MENAAYTGTGEGSVMRLAGIPIFTGTFWKITAARLIGLIRTRTTSSKGPDGRSYKKYSKQYKEQKSTGKIAGKDIKRQSSNEVNSPDLTLTGDMLRGLTPIPGSESKTGITIGWSGVEAEKVIQNELNKRFITTDKNPISDSEELFLKKEVDKAINKNISLTDENINIKLEF